MMREVERGDVEDVVAVQDRDGGGLVELLAQLPQHRLRGLASGMDAR